MLPGISATWVNTIGMRPPRLDWITVRRGTEKIVGWLRPASENSGPTMEFPPGLTVVDAKMWPWMTRRCDRWLNSKLLARQLSFHAKGTTAITTIPIVADLIGQLPVDQWVYYCVDDFSVWPGLDQQTMLRMEHEVVAKVDRIVVASDILQERIAKLGRESTLITHGIEQDFWNPISVEPYEWPENVTGPVALFWGVCDRRMDAAWVIELSQRHLEGSIVFVGPQQDVDPRIRTLPNVHFLDAVDVSVLPSMAHAAACLIMPYIDADITRAMQPLKLKEYLATGRPVVVRSLPSTRQWSDCLDVATTAEVFTNVVLDRISTGVPEKQLQSRQRLGNESWSAKAESFRAAIQ